MDIVLRLVFNDTTAWDVLNALARHNAILYRAYPSIPGLYESGTRYEREKKELWSDVVHMYRAGHEDCDALAAARAGELMARGWRALTPEDGGYQVAQYLKPDYIPAEVILRTKTDPNGIGPYHCIVRYQVGNHWYRDDPSARLGMYGPRRLDNPFGPHNEARLRRKGMVPEANVTARDHMYKAFNEARLAGQELFGHEYELEIGRRFIIMADADIDIEGDFDDESEVGWRTRDERREDRAERRAKRHKRRADRKKKRYKRQMSKAKKWKERAKEHSQASRPKSSAQHQPTEEELDQTYQWRRFPRSFAPAARRNFMSDYDGRGVTQWPAMQSMQPPETDLDPRWTSAQPNTIDDFMVNEPDIIWETVDEEILQGIIDDGLLQGAWEASFQRANQIGEAVLSGDLDAEVAQSEIGFIRRIIDNIKERRAATAEQRKAEKQNRKDRRQSRKLKRQTRRIDRLSEKQAAAVQAQNQTLGIPPVPGATGVAPAPGAAQMTTGLTPVGPGISMASTQPGLSGAVINLGQGLYVVRQVPTGSVTPANQLAVQTQTLQLVQQAMSGLAA